MSTRNYKWLSKPENFICKIYSKQKYSSAKRGHLPPEYTLNELREYLMNDTNYIDIFNKYLESGRDKNLAPSVDRVRDLEGYSFGNIRICTWFENSSKAKELLCHKVLHTNNNGIKTEHISISEAARHVGTSKQMVQSIVTGKTKKSKFGKFERL